MNQQELNEVMRLHRLWLRGSPGGVQAELSCADLCKADLTGANLRGVDLRGADLSWTKMNQVDFRGADLREADLSGADLSEADLREADLSEVKLTGANLCAASFCGANLRGADFDGADLKDAGLSEVDLSGATGLPTVPSVEGLVSKIRSLVDANPDALEMDDVHTCATTHCLAGWAVTLAGAEGAALEKKLGWNAAGGLIFHASCGVVPDFYSTNEAAIEWLNKNARRRDS